MQGDSIVSTEADVFWRRVDMRVGECWPWMGSRQGIDGYGHVMRYPPDGPSQWVGAHRVAWELSNGRPVPYRYQVMHLCDNPPCVRPSHLRAGTQSENMQDMIAKGRGPWDRYWEWVAANPDKLDGL